MALSLFNDPFFSESRLTPMGNMFGSSIFDTGLDNMGINRMMTAMPLRVTETDDQFKVLAEIPGVTSKKDVVIKVDQGVLSITAEKKKEKVQDTEILHREEVQYGKLVRSIRIPDYVIPNNSRAVLNDGVLEIMFEKSPSMKDQALHIPIETD
jgi:HSP20 family protein